MIHKFPRYLRGYVEFKVYGKGIENFLAQCNKNNINIFDARLDNQTFYAKCLVCDYKKFINIPLLGLRRKIIKRKGVRFKIHRYRKRLGLLFGFVLMIAILIFLSGFIWKIEIVGNERLSDNLILQTLEQYGFYEGTKKSSVNISQIENEMMRELCDLSRISINLDGSIAQIEVTERTMPPVMEDFSKPSNIIAAFDGKILKMEIVKGKPIAKVGSGVVKGEVLVSGHYLDRKENEIIEHSSGKITAIVDVSKTFKIPLEKNIIKKVKGDKTFSVIFFNKEFEFGKKSDSSQYKSEKKYNLSLLGLDFPIIFVKNTYFAQKASVKELTKEEAKQEILMAIDNYEKSELYGGKIKRKEIVWSENNGVFKAVVDFSVIIDIAEQQYIDSNQNIQ